MGMPKMDYEAIEDLQTEGASKELAQAIVRYVHEKQTHLATKADLSELRTELVETRESLRTEMVALEMRLNEKMTAIQTKLIIWLIGTAIGIVALVATIFQWMK